mgnify:CR=1 FL=1
MKILGIETSCDETSLAIVEARGEIRKPEFNIQKLLTASQIETHRPFGGVVPNLAKIEHANNLPLLFGKIFGISKFESLNPKQIQNSKNQPTKKPTNQKIDIVAVTVGPGLEPCLWQGIEFAKKIQNEHFPKAKIVPTNHLHGHMYSFLLPQKNLQSAICNLQFPAIQLLVSGGHTILIYMKSLTEYRKLGETRDDAAGEAFDKVARMLGLPYPGGPEIERLAKTKKPSNQKTITFPRPMLHDKNYDFSFSGLKTAVLYYLRDNPLTAKSYKLKALVAAAFQKAAIDVLVTKTLRAAKEYNAKSIILSGGVARNQALRSRLRQVSKVNGQMFISAPPKYQGDNAAMIAIAGYITYMKKKKYPQRANGSLDI